MGIETKQTSVWVVRACYTVVGIINVVCALQFICMPSHFAGAYELYGTSGEIALQGLGIAFLMWNATYPAFIVKPKAYSVVGVIILIQQVIGCVGETILLICLPVGHDILAHSIMRFILFDGAGLIIMGASFAWFMRTVKKGKLTAQ